jgi:hypothetical protein
MKVRVIFVYKFWPLSSEDFEIAERKMRVMLYAALLKIVCNNIFLDSVHVCGKEQYETLFRMMFPA